ncbi:MAG TPA: hypothetical protein VNC78_02930 [Actinomycetota bacterium]|nr:hypothetical protein [Actinomycetota bacterium]
MTGGDAIKTPYLSVTLGLMVALWMGARWAFTAVLGTLFLEAVLVVPLFVMANLGRPITAALAITSVTAQLILLIHPLTRSWVQGANSEDRATQRPATDYLAVAGGALIAISLFVVTPVLWATGALQGLALILLVCALSVIGVALVMRGQSTRASDRVTGNLRAG